jgi:hypothetical protein
MNENMKGGVYQPWEENDEDFETMDPDDTRSTPFCTR